MALDFSLLGQGPQFQNILASYKTGQAARKESDTKNALALYATDPEQGIKDITKVDPILGFKLRDDFNARQKQAQTKQVFAEPDPAKRQAAATQTGDPTIIEATMKMSEAERTAAKEKAETFGRTFYRLSTLPPEQRAAEAQTIIPALRGAGMPDAEIEAAQKSGWSDEYLGQQIAAARSLDSVIDQANKDRTFQAERQDKDRSFGLDTEKFKESKRHNQVDEGQGAAKLGIEGQRLGLEGQRVAIARQAAGVGPGSGKPPTEDQAKTAFNVQRMMGASQKLNSLEKTKGFNPTFTQAGSMAALTPLAAFGTGTASREYQSAKQEWSDALIRQTTGAAATKQEIEAVDKAYFPQIGDSLSTIKYKASRRDAAESAGAQRASGKRPDLSAAPTGSGGSSGKPTLADIFN